VKTADSGLTAVAIIMLQGWRAAIPFIWFSIKLAQSPPPRTSQLWTCKAVHSRIWPLLRVSKSKSRLARFRRNNAAPSDEIIMRQLRDFVETSVAIIGSRSPASSIRPRQAGSNMKGRRMYIIFRRNTASDWFG
jgi:hypothetical protein